MKKTIVSAIAVMMLISLSLTGCGNDHNNVQPTIVTNILSDPAFDGDILQTGPTSFTITQGMTISPLVQSVFAGINPNTLDESRAFLDFPLTGANGVPSNAVIVSATLDILIDSIQPLTGTIPIRIDLVSFQPPTLIASDFDLGIQPALAITTFPIFSTDLGNHVSVDVTSLMVKAQNLGLPDFQVRILEDLGAAAPGLIQIDDTTGSTRSVDAPLLRVEFF